MFSLRPFPILTYQEGNQTNTIIISSLLQIEGDIGNDFVGNTQVATFTSNTSISYVTFTVRDDNEPENTEVFQMKLVPITNDITLGQPNTLSVTIAANDDAFGVFGFMDVSSTS
jgi:hypothetical protein